MSDALAAYWPGYDLRTLTVSGAAKPAIVSTRGTVTFGELSAAVDQAAGALRCAGVVRGDRILVMSRSGLELLTLVLAAAQLGAVTVPANWRMSAVELAAVIEDCQPSVAFADAGLRDLLPAELPVVMFTADGESADMLSYANWLERAAGEPETEPLRPDDPVLQIYTSGTSGTPKGVLLTNANLAEKVRRMGELWQFTGQTRSLLATPLFHIGGLSWGLIGLAARATVYIPDQAESARLVEVITTGRITHAFLVPKMLQDIIDTVERHDLASSPFEVIVCGGAPVTDDLQLRAMRTLGCAVIQVYGMTETTGAIVQLDAAAVASNPEGRSLLRSCGTPYPWVEVEIRDPRTGEVAPQGGHGEVWTRSRQNCAGYWHRPLDTAELLVDGWLRTGDGGYLDEHGYLYLVDRIKDMIVSGGENIYSAEVERALLTHPMVADAAVVGLPDDEWGEIVAAVVVPVAEGQPDADSLAEHVARTLGRYKRPRRIVFRDALPRNATGKVLKRELRSELEPLAQPGQEDSPPRAPAD